jgi:transposase
MTTGRELKNKLNVHGSVHHNIISQKEPTRCNHVVEFIIPMFLKPLKAELNPICHLLALLGAHHILHVSRIRVNCSTCFG